MLELDYKTISSVMVHMKKSSFPWVNHACGACSRDSDDKGHINQVYLHGLAKHTVAICSCALIIVARSVMKQQPKQKFGEGDAK